MSAGATILGKVFSIFLLILVGFVASKRGMLSAQGVGDITSLLMKIVVPCVIVHSFISARGQLTLTEMALAAALPILAALIGLSVARLSFRKEKSPPRKNVLQYAVAFSNTGYMGLPLAKAIVGDSGMIYASFGVVVFNIFTWTFGYRMMNRESKRSAFTALLNPGVLGLLMGLPIYFSGIQLPDFLLSPLNMMSNLNTPLAMVVIGTHISKLPLKALISDKAVYLMSGLRLLLCPALFLAVMLPLRALFPFDSRILLTAVLQAATPTAANCVLFATQFRQDALLASKTVAVSTLLSIVTIPLFILLTQTLTG